MKKLSDVFNGLTRHSFLSIGLGMFFLIYVSLKVWATQAPNINWDIALSGFSPIDWVNHFKMPQNFNKDFPQGSHHYNTSLFMYVYRLADSIFSISPERLISGVILFEMLFIGLASVIFFRALIANAPPIAAFVFAVLVVNSGARSMELAGFGGPFFWGLYYNFADGMRLMALAMVLQRRFLIAGLLFSLSVMTHPIMGLMGGVLALGCLLGERNNINYHRIFLSSVVFLLLAGGWWIYHLQGYDVASIGVPSDIWITYSKAFNYHFYPVDNGLLTFAFERRLLAFLALLMLATFYVSRIDLPDGVKNGILIGGALLIITILTGLSISYWSSSPALIKLTLTRASDMLILVSLAVVVAGLMSTLENGRFFQAAIAAGLLLAPFLGPPFPVIYVFLAVIANTPILKRANLTVNDKIMLVLLVIFGAFIFLYYELGYVHANYETAYLGHKSLWLLTLFIGGAVLLADLFRPWFDYSRRLCLLIVFLIIISKSLGWRGTVNHSLSDKPLGEAYLHAQLWAKENTDPAALFMVDPTIYYGWRDFSQRSSFGNLREWLHTSWGYDSKKSNYKEGLMRASEFGYVPPAYLGETPPLSGFDKIDKLVGENFYSYDASRFLNLSKKYQVNYIVMKKDRITVHLHFPIAYENDFFIIYKI